MFYLELKNFVFGSVRNISLSIIFEKGSKENSSSKW